MCNITEALNLFMAANENQMDVQKCNCGALTIYGKQNNQVSFLEENSPFPIDITFSSVLDSCNHCVNYWGLDILPEEEQHWREGYKGRSDYLACMAEEYDQDLDTVQHLADLLGIEEDFDGLVNNLQDCCL